MKDLSMRVFEFDAHDCSHAEQSKLPKFEEEITRLLAKIPPNTVKLEVGCGDGVLLKRLENAVGVDISTERVERARREGCKAYVLDFTSFDDSYFVGQIELDKFDVIVFRHSLEHIFNPTMAMLNAYRYLKLNGKLIIDFYDYEKRRCLAPGVVNVYTKEILSQLLEQKGFRVDEVCDSVEPFSIISARKSQEYEVSQLVRKLFQGRGSYE